MIKIVVDALGGDNSPQANVLGAVRAVNEINDIHVILAGDEVKINEILNTLSYDKERISIVNAPEVISCDEKPTEAFRQKKNSSLRVSFDLLKSGEADGLVSIGSTGALLTGGVLIGRIAGVKRPAFCPILPTVNGGIVSICDSGANVDCDALQLTQFAQMGSLYLKSAFNVENPRVALLNIGLESEKGNAVAKETYQILSNDSSINFVGNMESRDLLTGNYDLIVCDGFSGNVLLKSTEGACLEVMKLFKKVLTKNLKNKIGASLIKKDVYGIKSLMDYNNHGGSVLLGAKKTIVKGHGSSKEGSVFHCIKQAYNMEKNNLNKKIFESFNQGE